MGQGEDSGQESGTALGQIELRRLTRAELEKERQKQSVKKESRGANPMNRLVPFLDLFARLTDEELARLSGVSDEVVGQLRKQVVQVNRALARYVDLLPRLDDAELMRLTGASAKTVRFWRLCQPRGTPTSSARPDKPRDAEAGAPERVDDEPTGPRRTRSADADAPPPERRKRATKTGPHGVTRTGPHAAVSAGSGAHPAAASSTGSHAAVASTTGAHAAAPRGASRSGASPAAAASGTGPQPTTASEEGNMPGPQRRASPFASKHDTRPPEGGSDTSLGVTGEPFPGYDFDPEKSEEQLDREGIYIGLELPEPDPDSPSAGPRRDS